MDALEIAMDLEMMYSIDIKDEDVDNFETLDDIVKIILEKGRRIRRIKYYENTI